MFDDKSERRLSAKEYAALASRADAIATVMLALLYQLLQVNAQPRPFNPVDWANLVTTARCPNLDTRARKPCLYQSTKRDGDLAWTCQPG